MKSDLKAKRPKQILWSILKWIVLSVIVIFTLINMVFLLFQESFLTEAAKLPTGYVEKPDLIPSFDAFLSPRAGLLPEAQEEWPADEVAINFQKFDSFIHPRRGTLFYLHGNRGSMEQCRWEIEPFLQTGYDVWTMDYRGFGRSCGAVSEEYLLSDAEMVYYHVWKMENGGIDIVWGRSFGSGIATYLASRQSPKRLVLETPYWSLKDAVRQKYPFLLPFAFRYELPAHKFLEEVQCPVHFIHGDSDEKIPFESSKKLDLLCKQRNLKGKLHTIEAGRHNLRPSTLVPSSTDEAFQDALNESLDLTSSSP